MKLTSGCITFFSLQEFTSFVKELKLVGVLQLIKPVEDKTGKILFKENLPLKKNTVEKLSELEGQYKPVFYAKMTDAVLKEMARSVSMKALQCLEFPDNKLTKHLFEKTRQNYKSFVLNSFGSKKLIMFMYKLSIEHIDFFDYIASFAMLCLGIILPVSAHIKMIHRYSFLAGLCADISLADTDFWKEPVEDHHVKEKMASQAALYVKNMSLSDLIPIAIKNHVFNPKDPEIKADEETFDLIKNLEKMDPQSELDSTLQNADPIDADFSDENIIELLKEVLKIARFITRTQYLYREAGNYLQPLIEKLAYNAARGYFSRELVLPIVKKFEEYEKSARFMMKIAEIEKKCIKPPSAWAYPKPKAAQILCRNREYDCPNILMGRDIHVVTDHEAYGWVGLNLSEGKYPKCTLEEELLKLSKDILKD